MNKNIEMVLVKISLSWSKVTIAALIIIMLILCSDEEADFVLTNLNPKLFPKKHFWTFEIFILDMGNISSAAFNLLKQKGFAT